MYCTYVPHSTQATLARPCGAAFSLPHRTHAQRIQRARASTNAPAPMPAKAYPMSRPNNRQQLTLSLIASLVQRSGLWRMITGIINCGRLRCSKYCKHSQDRIQERHTRALNVRCPAQGYASWVCLGSNLVDRPANHQKYAGTSATWYSTPPCPSAHGLVCQRPHFDCIDCGLSPRMYGARRVCYMMQQMASSACCRRTRP